MLSLRLTIWNLHNLKHTVYLGALRKYCNYQTKYYMKASLLSDKEGADELIKKFAPKLIYNSVIERRILKFERRANKLKKSADNERLNSEPLPISLRYLSDDIVVKDPKLLNENGDEAIESKNLVQFPYEKSYGVESTESQQKPDDVVQDPAKNAKDEVLKRHELQKEMKNWMVAYDNYDDSCLMDEDLDVADWKINYGIPDPNISISTVPCGGCGALLHCKDTAIPGYIPSEIFKNAFQKGGTNLEAIICQRCHFLKYYNLALQVQVTPEDYPKVLTTISEKGGLVVLMVDLLDFPCSIWPGIGEIFGNRVPIVVVGNKVDLLPQDSKNFLRNIKQTLLNSVKLQGFATFNIKDVVLISAKTGFGVEELITKLLSMYRIKGDVYIVGSTNVGKSSLFNVFLQSDYCKIQAVDLIQRATTSVWPGTTLNLLKFPIKRPAGYRQYLRDQRLQDINTIKAEEERLRKEQLRNTKDPKYATLIGHIDITKTPNTQIDGSKDSFSIQGHANASGKFKMGINEKSIEFAYSKWCYDTPGVVQPDQLIHLLTTEELLLTLPKELILPRTFCLKPNSSLFIAGLARLDYVEGPGSIRFTVFASNELPITVCDINIAEEIYYELLGSDLFKVPTGNLDRMKQWPKLELAQRFQVEGKNWHTSVIDVVLSSAGWVAVTGRAGLQYKIQAWTPEKRGVYLRECLLPYAVALTGSRIKHSVAYHKHKFYLQGSLTPPAHYFDI